MLTATLAALAIVTQDQVPLLSAPKATAAQHATLWQGDSLEIRGVKGDYLQVYDHRRERAGYIPAVQTRIHNLDQKTAPELLAVIRFIRHAPGAESLGIAYIGAYLRAAPAEAIESEVFAALGEMADRLAKRASTRRNGAGANAAAAAALAHLEVAAYYGVNMHTLEQEGEIRFCYDGEAQRRVLALPGDEADKARAALALTQHECVAASLSPLARYEFDVWRAAVLDRVQLEKLPEVLKNRIKMRQAGVWASLAYQRARRAAHAAGAGKTGGIETGQAEVMEAGQRAMQALAGVNKGELVDYGDTSAYANAAIRVGASRWAFQPQKTTLKPEAGPVRGAIKPGIVVLAGEPGQTCLHLVDAQHSVKNPLLSRCTYGVVWPASLSIRPDGKALALAVQTQEAWREMWVFQQTGQGWQLEVLPPGVEVPDLGYVEFSGWVPGGSEMLATREIRTQGRYKTSFELLRQSDLGVQKWADKPSSLTPFYRWQDPVWKAGTVSLR